MCNRKNMLTVNKSAMEQAKNGKKFTDGNKFTAKYFRKNTKMQKTVSAARQIIPSLNISFTLYLNVRIKKLARKPVIYDISNYKRIIYNIIIKATNLPAELILKLPIFSRSQFPHLSFDSSEGNFSQRHPQPKIKLKLRQWRCWIQTRWKSFHTHSAHLNSPPYAFYSPWQNAPQQLQRS